MIGIGLARVGLANSARDAAERTRDLGVGPRFTIRNVSQGAPDALLEVGAARSERQVELAPLTVEIRKELCTRLFEQRCRGLLRAPSPFDHDDRTVFFEDGQVTHWAVKRKLRHVCVVALPVAARMADPGTRTCQVSAISAPTSYARASRFRNRQPADLASADIGRCRSAWVCRRRGARWQRRPGRRTQNDHRWIGRRERGLDKRAAMLRFHLSPPRSHLPPANPQRPAASPARPTGPAWR